MAHLDAANPAAFALCGSTISLSGEETWLADFVALVGDGLRQRATRSRFWASAMCFCGDSPAGMKTVAVFAGGQRAALALSFWMRFEIDGLATSLLEVEVVEDITKKGAFDGVVKGVYAVMHLAAPFFFDAKKASGEHTRISQ